MRSDKSPKDPFEFDDEEDESASSVNSEEQEHKELFIESSENVPIDDESLLFSLTIHLIFLVLSSPIMSYKKYFFVS
jgi:hypothetical protein